MIGKLEGNVSYKDDRFLILNVGGVGYKVFTTAGILEKTKENDMVLSLWTHLAVRENALDLYGFIKKEELSFFELLISISGIGPKTALSILNIASIETLRRAVSSGDTSHLIKVSGIGKKNAEKIVLELKGKFEAEESWNEEYMQDEADTIEALTSLGYNQKEARESLKKISKDILGTSEKIKQALKILNNK